MSGKGSIAGAVEWAFRGAFVSECVEDWDGEPANVMDVLDEIGTSIRRLASGPEVAVAARTIAEGLHAIAGAIAGLAGSTRETHGKGVRPMDKPRRLFRDRPPRPPIPPEADSLRDAPWAIRPGDTYVLELPDGTRMAYRGSDLLRTAAAMVELAEADRSGDEARIAAAIRAIEADIDRPSDLLRDPEAN